MQVFILSLQKCVEPSYFLCWVLCSHLVGQGYSLSCACVMCEFNQRMCRMRRFLAVLRSVFHSSLLYTLSFHPFPPTSLPSSLTSSCHLFLGLPLSPVASKFIHNTFLGILFSSILCTCPNQRNLFNLLSLL